MTTELPKQTETKATKVARVALPSQVRCLSSAALVVYLDVMQNQVDVFTAELARHARPDETSRLYWLQLVSGIGTGDSQAQIDRVSELARSEIHAWLSI